MVDGLNVKYSVMLVPVIMFIYITAMLNPIIKLECVGDSCREKMRTEYDDDFGNYISYAQWRVGVNKTLQSHGNVTLMRFNHGYVKCDSSCNDCKGKENASETCTDYDDKKFQLLLKNLNILKEKYNDSNFTLPYWLNPNCSCKDWCKHCDDQDYVSLPTDGKHRTMQNYWSELETNCEQWENELGPSNGEMCKLFRSFRVTMILAVSGILMLGIVLMLMMFMEYTNFHIFYGGKCKFCFISLRAKKVLFTVLLAVPVTFMLVVGVTLAYGDTEEMLNNYFKFIGAEDQFNIVWNNRVVWMFWISMALGALSIVVMMRSGKTTRHLRTIINYRRGVVYSGGKWKPHSS